MEKLIEECKLDCPEEKQIQVLEKCLPFVGTDRDIQSRSMGWLLLARILERCSPQCLRAAQSRLAKKLVLIKNEPTIYGGIFLRQLLIRNPQVGHLHADVVHSIITRFIDLTISSGDQMLRRLSIELYSIRYGCDAQMSEVLLNTLSAAMAKRLLSQEEQAGQFVLRDDIMSILEAGLNDLQLREGALGTVRSLCTNGETAFLSVIPQVVTILISKLDAPSEALFDALTHICHVYGPGSTLFRHFYAICSALRHPLDEQFLLLFPDYGPSAGGLLSTVIQTSSFLIKPEILMSVQRKVSEQVVLNPNSSVYRDLLTSFLSCTHELVPPPVQIARTVISRCSNASYVQTLNCLCDIITRPRMQNLASHEIVCRSLVKLERDADMDAANGKEPFATTNSSGVEAFEEFENKICNALEGTVRQESSVEKPSGNQVATSFEQTAEVEKPSTSQEVVASTSTSSNGCNMDDEIMIEAVPAVSKRNLEEQIEFVPVVLKSVKEPSVKKTKKSDAQLQKPLEVTTLLDGELSVDEILSTFCPD